MKDSGVDWIGKVPEEWPMKRAKDVIITNDGGAWGEDPTETAADIIVLRSTEQTIDGELVLNNPAKRFLKENEIRATLLQKDDLIITKSSGSQDHIGKTSIIDSTTAARKCSYSNFLQRIRVRGFARFFWYLYNSKFIKWQFDLMATTTTGLKNLNARIIETVLFACPPLAEQRAIADYLDEKCGKVDERIALLEKKVEAYKKLKRSVINEAVTRGLDTSVKLKDSGVDWIGMVPEGWEVLRLKDCLLQKTLSSCSERKIGLENIESETGRFIDTEETFDGNGVAFEAGDIIYGKLRPYLAKVWLASFSGNAVGDFIVYKPLLSMDSQFAKFMMLSPTFTKFVNASTCGSKMPRVSPQFISGLQIPKPPLAEQRAIADYLDEKCGKIDKAIANIEKQIDAYKRLKRSLINEVVTGKRRVA